MYFDEKSQLNHIWCYNCYCLSTFMFGGGESASRDPERGNEDKGKIRSRKQCYA
jgi:hypothetical protein